MNRISSNGPGSRSRFPRRVALVACAAFVLVACEEPPPITATAPPPPAPPSAIPPPQVPSSLAAGVGADAAAELHEDHGGVDSGTRTSIPTRLTCRSVIAGDAGVADDGPFDGGGARRPAARPWKSLDRTAWPFELHGYESRVRATNQHPIGAAAVAFATWLNAAHNRVHPIWGDGFLGWLATLPCDDPKNTGGLRTTLELVVRGDDGRILHAGVLRSSGVEDFDVAAISAFVRAAPFAIAAPAIRSTDGNVYFRWEIFRDEAFACSTMNVRPFLLDVAPTP